MGLNVFVIGRVCVLEQSKLGAFDFNAVAYVKISGTRAVVSFHRAQFRANSYHFSTRLVFAYASCVALYRLLLWGEGGDDKAYTRTSTQRETNFKSLFLFEFAAAAAKLRPLELNKSRELMPLSVLPSVRL